MGQISYGTITIIDTGDVENIYIEYIKTNSSTSVPSQSDSGWSTSTPTWENGKYIWSRTATKYTGIVTPVYSSPVCITGGKGETGGKGDTGTAVSSITPLQYLHTSESSSPGKPTSTVTSTSTAAGQWTKAQPTWVSGKYMWTCTEVKYSNNTYAWTDPICANSMNKANSDAANAVSTANSAASTASAAAANASSALTAAQNAQTALNNYKDTNDTAVQALQSRASHFWWDSAGAHVASGTGTMSSSNVTENDPSTHGFNALMAPGALSLREKAVNLVQLATNALTFYIAPNGGSQGPKALEVDTSGMKIFNPVSSNNIALMELSSGAISFKDLSGNVQATFGNNGAIQSGNYSRGSAGTKFAAGGTKIDLINGEILTRYFRLSQGVESSVPAGAYIYGTVEAIDGKIGSNTNNYWYIGNYTDYNQNQSAAIKSYGSAFIQLGNSSTWRLATNRIHGAWNDDGGGTSGLLHYPDYNNKYWDSGLHLPTSLTDKFLYIRNAPNTEDLENLQNDLDDLGYDYWTYRFYVAGDGSVYARNIYVLDDNGNITPIGGADGVYLLKSGGTMTGSITMSNGGKFIGNLQGTADNASKVNNHTVNSDVPSGAIFTDKNVQTTQANTTKLYITGTATNGTNTGTLSYDSNVYLNTTAGDLRATTFNGYTLAAASAKGVDTSLITSSTSTNLPTSKAVVDLIKQYLPLTGGSITGPVNFGDSVSIDDLTAGNLIVNGAGRFTNGLYGDLIGNADTATKVGNDLKIQLNSGTTEGTNQFTFNGSAAKTVNITKSSIGLGNVENKSSATIRGELTSANVTTALGFTPYNSTNPNGYTTNTGTVTSVAASGSGGITISGSPITISGTITVGLNLSTAINGLGEGASNATRNDYIVAQYAGGGTTTTTYHRRKLSNIFAALNSSDITTALGYTPYDATNPNGYTTNTGTVTSVKVQGSNGLTGSGTVTTSGTITLSHSDTSSQASSSNSGRTYIQSITLDTYGHVTGLSTATETVTNTHNTAYLYAGVSNGSANAETTNGNTYLILVDGGNVTTRRKISGSGAATVTSDSSGNIAINTPVSLTGVSFDSGTITFSKSDGTTVPITTSDFVITQASGATALVRLKSGTTDEYEGYAAGGATTKPVYFDSNGHPVAVTSIPYSLLSDAPSSMTPKSHTHGNIQNGGTLQTNDITIANNDQLIVTDASDSNKIARTSIKFDGSTTTKALTPKGTWETFNNYSLPLAANGTRGGVQIGYTQSGKNYPVQLSSEKMYVNVPWENTTYSAGTGLSLSGTTFSNSGVTGIKGNAENSYRTGQVNLTPANIGAVDKTGDTMTGNLTIPASRIANTYYGISYGRTIETPVETILYTGIKWRSGSHMPVIHVTGYAYGLQSPVEFKIGFYIYNNEIGWCGATNMGSWAPDVYLFKYIKDEVEYVAVGFAGSCYFLQLSVDLQDEMGKFNYTVIDSSAWSWEFLTTAGTIPAPDSGVSCIKVPYRANILRPANADSVPWSGVTSKPTTISGYGITDAVLYGGVDTGLGSSTPASTAKEYYINTAKVPTNSIKMFLNSSGVEYTTLFSNRGSYGSILKWGYNDKYIRILRHSGGNWQSDDWEKISAGYADVAGSVNLLGYQTLITTLEDLNSFIGTGAGIQTTKVNAIEGHSGTLGKQDGIIISIPWNNACGHQLYIDDSTYAIHHRYFSTSTSSGTGVWANWVKMIDSSNYTDYTVTKTGTGASGTWGISISGNAATATSATSATTSSKTGDGGLILYAHNQNEVNFGGTNASSTIYLGYRAMDSKPIPSKFIFGGSTGTADLQVKSIYLGSGTSSYISSTNYTGKSATSGTADLATTTTTTADTSNALYPIGVTGGATTTLKRDTSITMTGGSINATNYIMSNKATMKYDANLDAIVFQF